MSKFTAKLLAVSSTLGLLLATIQPAKAATLKALNQNVVSNVFTECINDGAGSLISDDQSTWQQWYYSYDSISDGVNGLQVGGNVYEIFGIALKETKDSIWAVINGNMPLTGEDGTSADDGNIGWGDLFFNFSGKDFTTASNDKDLFAVRFAGTNDSPVSSVGLYGEVSAMSTTGINSGFDSIIEYNKRVTDYGGFPSFGDLPANTAYFDQNRSLNAIGSGQYLTGITYLSLPELQEAGYDTSHFGGSQTIAFKFDKSAICQYGSCKSVPEPSSALALVAAGLGMGILRLRRRKANTR